MRWILLLAVCAPAVAAADPAPPRASASVAVGFGHDDSVTTGGCGTPTRTLVALGGALGRGRLQLAGRLGFAVLDVPSAYCDSLDQYGEVTAQEAEAELGASVRTPPRWVRAQARALIGLEVLHMHTTADDDRLTAGLVVQLAGGVAFAWQRYWLGPELAVGVAMPASGSIDWWRSGLGTQATVLLVAGVDLY